MTTCPSGVNYMHLIDHGRNHVEATYKRPLIDRYKEHTFVYLTKTKYFFRISTFDKDN